VGVWGKKGAGWRGGGGGSCGGIRCRGEAKEVWNVGNGGRRTELAALKTKMRGKVTFECGIVKGGGRGYLV